MHPIPGSIAPLRFVFGPLDVSLNHRRPRGILSNCLAYLVGEEPRCGIFRHENYAMRIVAEIYPANIISVI